MRDDARAGIPRQLRCVIGRAVVYHDDLGLLECARFQCPPDALDLSRNHCPFVVRGHEDGNVERWRSFFLASYRLLHGRAGIDHRGFLLRRPRCLRFFATARAVDIDQSEAASSIGGA